MNRVGLGRKTVMGLLVAIVFMFIVLNVRVGYAEPSAAPRTTGYDVSWFVIDSGGGQNLTGGAYSLNSTIGQPDAGSQSGGIYGVGGGFWVDFLGNHYYIDMPLIRR